MLNPLNRVGRIHAPAYVFICGAQHTGDEDLLHFFDLSAEERIAGADLWGADRRQEALIGRSMTTIANSPKWVLLADDWLYRLWMNQRTKERLQELSRSGDVFACSVGEADMSYEIRLLRQGEMVRELVVDDPLTGPRHQVIVDEGDPLDGEVSRVLRDDVTTYVLSVAAANGFDIADSFETARVWVDVEDSWYTNLERASSGTSPVIGKWFK